MHAKMNGSNGFHEDHEEQNCPLCLMSCDIVILQRKASVDGEILYYCPLCHNILTKEEVEVAYEKLYAPLEETDRR